MLINVGESVVRGTPLFCHKDHQEILYVSPCKGKVSEINRGEKNTIIKIVNNEWLKENGYKIYCKANKMYGQSANYLGINDYYKNLDKIINDNNFVFIFSFCFRKLKHKVKLLLTKHK